jgi:hypothetical protein
MFVGKTRAVAAALAVATVGAAWVTPAAAAKTLSPVSVGFEYVSVSGGTAAAGAIGSKQSPGDEMAEYQTLVNNVNSHGGLLGHPITPVFFAYDPLGSQLSTQEQAMCASFTQDHHVFAALVLSLTTDTALSCLQRAGVVTIARGGYGSSLDSQVFRQFSHYVAAGSLSLDLLSQALVKGLHGQGFFGSGVKIGLVVDTGAVYTTAQKALSKALGTYGKKLADVASVEAPTSIQGLSQAAAGIQSAVLKFSSDGVNRVLFLEPTAAPALFMLDAQTQGYHPRYGLSTNDELTMLVPTVSPSQLTGAAGIGWYPLADVPSTSSSLNAAGKACLNLLNSDGANLPSQSTQAAALTLCDQMTVLQTATKLGKALSANAFMHGLNAAGSSIKTAAFFALNYSGRRDGIAAVRDLAFEASCPCFQYSGSTTAP